MVCLTFRVVRNTNAFLRTVQQLRWYSETSKSKLSYMHHIGKHPLLYQTVGDLVDLAAEKYPNRDAIIFCENRQKFTFQQVKTLTDNLAAGLLQIGMQKGDKLALWGPNTFEWYLTFFSAAKVGIISVLLNPVYTKHELEYSLNKAEVSAIFSTPSFRKNNYYEMINNLNGTIKSNIKYVFIADENKFPNTRRWSDLLDLGKGNEAQKMLTTAKNKVIPDDPLTIQFSSGTTGQPKASLASHYNFVNNSYHTSLRHELFEKYHKLCLQTPFFHVFATVICLCPSFHSGTTIVVPSAYYSPLKTLTALQNEQCTAFNGTPTMHVDIVKLQKEHKFKIDQLDFVVSGGAPCTPALFQDILKVLKPKCVKSVFGLTETTAVVFQSLPGDDEYYSTQTVGHLVDHVEARVVNENGLLVPFGTPGELHIRGYLTMLEYFNDFKRTIEAKDKSGWLKTGDQFILYENGYGKIVGRLKDMIIRGGENIFPKEIEDVINMHSEVLESQVLGVDDDRLGEEVAVCLKVNAGSTITLEDVNNFCAGKISDFKIPKYLKIVDDFPKTASGKIQKYKLKQLFKI